MACSQSLLSFKLMQHWSLQTHRFSASVPVYEAMSLVGELITLAGRLPRQNFPSGMVHLGLFFLVFCLENLSMGFTAPPVLFRLAVCSYVPGSVYSIPVAAFPWRFPRAHILLDWCCWEVESVQGFLLHLLDFPITFCFCYSYWCIPHLEKGSLYREMDLTSGKKQVTSHHFICLYIHVCVCI